MFFGTRLINHLFICAKMMEAVFVKDLQEDSVLVAAGVVRAFLDAWPAGLVEDRLWTVYRLAVRGGLCEGGSGVVPLSAEEVASLLDQLIVLVRAVHVLPGQQEGGARYLGVVGGPADV